MKEDLVSFELAKKLKEKGFDYKCHYCYKNSIIMSHCSEQLNHNADAVTYSAPTISQVLKWLREEKKIFIEPCIIADCNADKTISTYFSFSITHIETGDTIYLEYARNDEKRFDAYEKSALAGIEYTLDNLI